MATTLATKKQSEAIRKRMAEIRSDLPYDVDLARDRVKQLADWRYHISRRPVPILIAAAVAGYLIVPAKPQPKTIVMQSSLGDRGRRGLRDSEFAQPAKRGMVGGIAAAVGTMLLKQAAMLAANQVSGLLTRRKTS